jgi:hypothetical protein
MSLATTFGATAVALAATPEGVFAEVALAFAAAAFAVDLPAFGRAAGFVETDVISIMGNEPSTVVAGEETGVEVTLWAVRTVQPAVKRMRCRNQSARC